MSPPICTVTSRGSGNRNHESVVFSLPRWAEALAPLLPNASLMPADPLAQGLAATLQAGCCSVTTLASPLRLGSIPWMLFSKSAIEPGFLRVETSSLSLWRWGLSTAARSDEATGPAPRRTGHIGTPSVRRQEDHAVRMR